MHLSWDTVFKKIYTHLKLPKDILSPLFAHVKCFLFISMGFPLSLFIKEREKRGKKWYRAHFKIHESWILPKFQQDYREISSGKYYVLFLSLLKLLHNLTACGIVPHFKVNVYKYLARVQHSSPYGPQCLQPKLFACAEVENQSFPRENYGNFNKQAHFHDSLKTALILMHLHFKKQFLRPFVDIAIGWEFFFFIREDSHCFRKIVVSWIEMKVQYDNCCEWETQHRPSETFSLKYFWNV